MNIPALSPLLQQTLLAMVPRLQSFRPASQPVETVALAPHLPPTAIPPATSVQMLVALAAAEPPIERRRRIAVGADRGLAMLERLHAELLLGAAPPERLHELAAWSESLAVPEDPRLAGLARDIELRVRVELAKHDLIA